MEAAKRLRIWFPGGSEDKASVCNEEDPGFIPGLGRSLGEGNGNPLQYLCLEKSHGPRSLVGYSPWGHLFVFNVKNVVLNHLWLCWVLVALHKFSLLVVSGGNSLNCGAWAPHCGGFSCGARATECMGCGNCGSQA